MIDAQNHVISTLPKATMVNCLNGIGPRFQHVECFNTFTMTPKAQQGLQSVLITATTLLQRLQHEHVASTDRHG